jgi:hypothetical protein
MNIDIAIDAFRLIAEPRTSGAFYVAELTKALNDQDGIGIITLLLPRPVDKNFLFSNLLALERVRVIQPSAPCFPERSFCSNLWWIQGVIPKLLKKQPPDWFIAPYHQTPLRLNRKTLVITLIMDVCGLSPFAGYYWYKKGPYRHLINFMTALLRADVFVYISYHTKQSFEHIFPFAKWRKSAVINCGLTLQTLSPVDLILSWLVFVCIEKKEGKRAWF